MADAVGASPPGGAAPGTPAPGTAAPGAPAPSTPLLGAAFSGAPVPGDAASSAPVPGAPASGDPASSAPLTCAGPLVSLTSPGSMASPLPESPRKTVMFAPYVASFCCSRDPRLARRPDASEHGTRSQGV